MKISFLFLVFLVALGFMNSNVYCDDEYYEDHGHEKKHGRKDKHDHCEYEWYNFFMFWKNDTHHNKYDDEKEAKCYQYRDLSRYQTEQISKVKAKKIVEESFKLWSLGDVWKKKNKTGGIEIVVPIEYNNQFIGELKISPESGLVLPENVKSYQKEVKISKTKAKEKAYEALSKVIISDIIRKGRHNYWEVPLLLDGIEIEEVKVGMGSGRILPDLIIHDELKRNGF